MAAELSKEQRVVLQRTAQVEDPAEFQALLARARPRMDLVVKEVMEPDQAVSTTLTELRDLAIALMHYEAVLPSRYDAAKREGFLDAIRLAATAQVWFGDGFRAGAFRARPVAAVVAASRPWRDRLRVFAQEAFPFDPEIADQFDDVNSSGTLEEEVSDLGMLNSSVEQHRAALEAVGMTEGFVQQGKTLYEEANGRDLAAIVGVRNLSEATALRNRLLTYVTLLAREARAVGVNACYDDPAARRRFEATSFRSALRSVRGRRSRPTRPDPIAPPSPPAPTDAKPTPGDSGTKPA